MTKEEKRDYDKIYKQKNKQKIAAQNKIYRENNKKKRKEYNESNKQKIAEYNEIYHQTPKGKKSTTISRWKRYGIITDDYDYWYELYLKQNHCWHCENEFINSLDRNLDHNHQINDKENIRGILCRTCNVKDVYK